MNAVAFQDQFMTQDLNAKPIIVPANNGLWYVLHHRTEPRTVALMLEDMADQGFEAYLPQYLRYRRVMRGRVRSSTPQWVPEPLFRGYVFVRQDVEKARGPKSIARLYGIEGLPIGAIQPDAVDKMRAKETAFDVTRDDGTIIRLCGFMDDDDKKRVPVADWRANLMPGETVEFEVLADFDLFLSGVVEANEKGRLRILADYMGRSSQFVVDLPRRVRPVEASAQDMERKAS